MTIPGHKLEQSESLGSSTHSWSNVSPISSTVDDANVPAEFRTFPLLTDHKPLITIFSPEKTFCSSHHRRTEVDLYL